MKITIDTEKKYIKVDEPVTRDQVEIEIALANSSDFQFLVPLKPYFQTPVSNVEVKKYEGAFSK